jgi:hypothetical protein
MNKQRYLAGFIATVAGGFLATGFTLYGFYYVVTRYMSISKDNTILYLMLFGIMLLPVIGYSYWVAYKRYRLQDNDIIYKEMENMVRFKPRDFKLLLWFLSIVFIPIFVAIYSHMLSFAFLITTRIFISTSKIKHTSDTVMLISIVFAIITYYKIAISLWKHAK